MQMQEFRSAHVHQLAQDAHEVDDIIAVEGSEVPDVHSLEDILLMADGTLQRIIEADDTLPALVGEHSP